MKVIYLVYDGLTNPVFDSQVLTMLEFLKSQGRGPNLLVSFEPFIKNDFLQKMNEVIKRLETDVVIIKRLPFINRLSLRTLAQSLVKIVVEHMVAPEPLILHCRGQIAAYIAIQTKLLLPHVNIKVLADIRGVPEELLMRSNLWRGLGDQLRYREMKKVEREVYTSADRLCCVSNSFKYYICKNFGCPADRILVVYCSVNTNRFRFDSTVRARIRDELRLEDNLVFAYSGSLSPWQVPDKIFEFFIMAQKACPNSCLLILTKDVIAARKLLQKYDKYMANVMCLSMDYSRVPDHLMAADVGLLLREDTLVNKVAFPTKYAEYLSCGLFVVTTQGVMDIASYTMTQPVTGYVLQHFAELDSGELRNLIMQLYEKDFLTDMSRQERHTIAANMFGIERNFSKYIEIYDALANS